MIILSKLWEFIWKHKGTIAILVTILGLLGTVFYMNSRLNDVIAERDIAVLNNKAYEADKQADAKVKRQYEFTLNQLKDSKDSVDIKLKNAIKALGIKNNKILYLQYYIDHFEKEDSIVFRDSVIAKGVNTDTIVGDKFYSIYLHLKYPNTIITKPSFTNEKEVIITKERETIDPPYKFFLLRWFQAKQDVVIVNIKDENPYLVKTQSKFIKVFKK